MTTQLLATELANLIQESKRKHQDLRQAAEKSLEELKQLGNISEQAAAEQISRKLSFVNPLIIACGTKNAKFTGLAIVCLQRLIVARALPHQKLDQVLEALMQASSAGLDVVKLKILQALPSLFQNYAPQLTGDLLVTALNICFILQSSKNAILNNTAAATLQQLLVSVFDKVVDEDKNASNAPIAGQSSTATGQADLRASALDAYRVFSDLCLMTENQRPEFLRFAGLPQTFGLELIESVITNHTAVIDAHPEQAHILRTRVIPLIVSTLRGKPSFATTVRLFRVLYTMLRRHLSLLPSECGDILEILIHLLDQDTVLWQRALCMEVFRGIFAEHALVQRIYDVYDAQESGKNVLKPLVATFVRLSSERPAIIGLGYQSTIPAADTAGGPRASSDQVVLEASAMSGIIGGGSLETAGSNTGIGVHLSSIRVPCIDQLDKTEPPIIPESYIYSLVLTCISSLSDGLAKFILPLTVPGDSRNRRKAPAKHDRRPASPVLRHAATESPIVQAGSRGGSLEVPASSILKKTPVLLNPLELQDHPFYADVKICASIVDECWPAILATCSTFLYASLDHEYYHGLVRSFQRFAHVAGLLHLSTPRDAFLTTLGKSAVPPNVLTACRSLGSRPPTPGSHPETPTTSLLSNARGLLGVDSLSPTSSSSPTWVDRQRHGYADVTAASTLNTRNLLCLRALLNLGIALGPTLGSAWRIILETLQQADFVLFSSGKAAGRTPSLSRSPDTAGDNDTSSLMSNFSSEIRAVETAASRIIESSVDFPDSSFFEMIDAISSLEQRVTHEPQAGSSTKGSPTTTINSARQPQPDKHRRILSFSSQISGISNQEYLFVLTKLGEISSINVGRLVTSDPETSGWHMLMGGLVKKLGSPTMTPPVRIKAAELLSQLMLKAAGEAIPKGRQGNEASDDTLGKNQLRVIGALRDALTPLIRHARGASVANQSTDIDVHKIILEGLKSIIERSGENLVRGWETAFEIVGSVFETGQGACKDKSRSGRQAQILMTRSPKLVRSSFSSLQLICSDFLASLPRTCFPILVDTLYKFCSQVDDLNIALTTVTLFWILSDFLSTKEVFLNINTKAIKRNVKDSGFSDFASDGDAEGSDTALWMLFLLRLTTVTTDERLELRNSAIQTLLRILDACGDRLGADAWSLCVELVAFKLLFSIEAGLEAAEATEVAESEKREWHETAVVVLSGISNLMANYLDVLTSHQSFSYLWRELLVHLTKLLDFRILSVNGVVFKALTHILSHVDDEKKASFDEAPAVWDIWSRGIPASKREVDSSGKAEDNSNFLMAYVGTFHEVYKLFKTRLTADKVQRMLGLLQETAKASTDAYSLDVEHPTALQSQVLEAVQVIRTDINGVPSTIIKQLSEFVALAYSQERAGEEAKDSSKQTFIAMSKASMLVLQMLVLKHCSDKEIYTSGALAAALSALCHPIKLKYCFPVVTKSTQPWKLATRSALTILDATLGQMDSLEIPEQSAQTIWALSVSVADGILCVETDGMENAVQLVDDERFDMESFRELRDLIIPSLGREAVDNKTRKAYVESLFRTCIIHPLTEAEKALTDELLDECSVTISEFRFLNMMRAGRTMAVAPKTRTRMAYVAFDELFSLTWACTGQEDSNISQTGEVAVPSSCSSPLRQRMAKTAAPLFLVRCALTIRDYAADQPLRGRMPQPLSQRKELAWILRKLVEPRSENEAIPAVWRAGGEGRKHLPRLYPLLVKALDVSVRGDREVQQLLRKALEAIGRELGVA